MALSNGTVEIKAGGAPGNPLFAQVIEFDLDNAYPNTEGGYGPFSEFVEALTGGLTKNLTIIAVLPVDCKGYTPIYDAAADLLQFWYADYDAGADGPLIEVANDADLAAVTNVRVLVLAH